MSPEFLQKLKGSLELLDSRISALEHIVNDVIIGGLQSAADEYADDEAYSVFCDNYSDIYSDLEEPAKIIYSDDYDLSSDLYETIKKNDKSVEGYDERAEVEKLVKLLRDKVDALKGKPEVPEETKDELEKEAEEVIDEADLARIFKGK